MSKHLCLIRSHRYLCSLPFSSVIRGALCICCIIFLKALIGAHSLVFSCEDLVCCCANLYNVLGGSRSPAARAWGLFSCSVLSLWPTSNIRRGWLLLVHALKSSSSPLSASPPLVLISVMYQPKCLWRLCNKHHWWPSSSSSSSTTSPSFQSFSAFTYFTSAVTK